MSCHEDFGHIFALFQAILVWFCDPPYWRESHDGDTSIPLGTTLIIAVIVF